MLSEREAVLSLWYNYDSSLGNFFSVKRKQRKKKKLISHGKIKNEKSSNENENPIILALLIEQEAALSL